MVQYTCIREISLQRDSVTDDFHFKLHREVRIQIINERLKLLMFFAYKIAIKKHGKYIYDMIITQQSSMQSINNQQLL